MPPLRWTSRPLHLPPVVAKAEPKKEPSTPVFYKIMQRPTGTKIYGRTFCEIGYVRVLGSESNFGFHYREGSGYLAAVIAGGAQGAAAQQEANRTGRTVTYQAADAGDPWTLNVDATEDRVRFDLGINLDYGDDESPWLVNINTNLGYPTLLGFGLGLMAPIHALAFVETSATIGFAGWNLEVQPTLNLGNRAFLRGGFGFTSTFDDKYDDYAGTQTFFTVGARL
ncbi:MAG: hypothetical protein H6686_05480 [Fibrobacteria bacterium]|nr:hypothetical protein [Fibrobacteria bacterium]